MTVDIVLQLDPDLPLSGLVPDEGVLKEVFGAGSLLVVHDGAHLNEAVEAL